MWHELKLHRAGRAWAAWKAPSYFLQLRQAYVCTPWIWLAWATFSNGVFWFLAEVLMCPLGEHIQELVEGPSGGIVTGNQKEIELLGGAGIRSHQSLHEVHCSLYAACSREQRIMHLGCRLLKACSTLTMALRHTCRDADRWRYLLHSGWRR